MQKEALQANTAGNMPHMLDTVQLMAGALEDLTPLMLAQVRAILPQLHVATLKYMVAALKLPKKTATRRQRARSDRAR